MRLGTIRVDGQLRAVIECGEFLIDIASIDPGSAPSTVRGLIAAGVPTLHRLAEAAARAVESSNSSRPLRPDAVSWAPPIPDPSKIILVGLNYRDHCRETGADIPSEPLLFAKYPSALIGHREDVIMDRGVTQQVDYEAELGVVIGRECRAVAPRNAGAVVAGYVALNDVSARDLQRRFGHWSYAKSLDTFGPMGPFITTSDEIPEPGSLGIECWVNGERRQSSTTAELVFDVLQLVAYASRACTLYPGDVIATGTPGGVGHRMSPPVFLGHGDVVEVRVEGLAALTNTFREVRSAV